MRPSWALPRAWPTLAVLVVWAAVATGTSNNYDCTVNRNCLSCVRDPGYSVEADGQTECHWCVYGTSRPWDNFDGECRNDMCFGIDVRTRIHTEAECPISSCSSRANCEDCLDDRSVRTDCQWCFASGKCVDYYGKTEGDDAPCADPRALRITGDDDRTLCPPRSHRLNTEMFFGFLGLLSMVCLCPCFLCRWCLQPCVSWHDALAWVWRKTLIKGKDEFGAGATFAKTEVVSDVITASRERKGAGKLLVDGDD